MAFAPFGEVIELDGGQPLLINDGRTQKYARLAELESRSGSSFSLHLYRSKAAPRPVTIARLERHLLGHQAFIPLHSHPFPVVVAPAGPQPSTDQVQVFISNGRQGINLSPGTWHHYQISLEEGCEYLVAERTGAETDCEEYALPQALILQFDSS
ncbi:MAG: ureidoglycolate lyase [Xanthomonadales bacterium]|nr:ureidoglycolate lyase [Xanthomonadales bacterium]